MRDHSLDLLKGGACILMFFAHTYLQVDLFSKIMTFLGAFSPILFFAVSGIVADMQARKYPVFGISMTYAMIFLLGLSFVAIVAGNFWVSFEMDILQIIAVGVLVLYFVQRYLRPSPLFHLGVVILLFVLKVITDPIDREGSLIGLFGGVVFEPGNFVLIPWLYPFFLGMFCYLSSNRHNLWLAGASALLLVIAQLSGVTLGLDNRWDMSMGYFLFSLLLTAVAFYIARALSQDLIQRAFPWVLWLGKNSLLFLYVHITIALLIEKYTEGIWGSYLIWPAVAASSLFLMWSLPIVMGHLRVPVLMERFSAWIGLLALVLLAPLVLPVGAPLMVTEWVFGMVFSLYYTSITKALKGLTGPRFKIFNSS